MQMPCQIKYRRNISVIPLFVEVINEAVLIFVSSATASMISAEGDAGVAATGWEEAGAGRSEDYEHILAIISA